MPAASGVAARNAISSSPCGVALSATSVAPWRATACATVSSWPCSQITDERAAESPAPAEPATILIAEDNVDTRRPLAHLLKMAGYRVVTASNALRPSA